MTEDIEVAENTSGETQVASEPVSSSSTSIIGDDGKFTEEFYGALPEDIRNEQTVRNVKDPSDAMRQLVNAQKLIGRDKIAMPKEDSSASVWDEFFRAGGRPETAADYNLKRPDDFPEELFSTDLAGQAQELFHELGISQKQADALLAFNLNTATAAFQEQQQAQELAQKESLENLYKDWGSGAAFEQKKYLATLAVKEAVGEDIGAQERLTEKFGDDPDFIRAMSVLGAKFAESTGAPQTPPTPVAMKDMIAEEMATLAYKGGPEIPMAEHEASVAKVARMIEEKVAAEKRAG